MAYFDFDSDPDVDEHDSSIFRRASIAFALYCPRSGEADHGRRG